MSEQTGLPASVVVCSNTLAEYIGFFKELLPVGRYRMELFTEVSDEEYRALSRGGMSNRLRLRFRMLVVYPLRLLWRIWRDRGPTTYVVTTNTFFAPWMAATLGRNRGVRVVHLLYDLYPEALAVAEEIRLDSLAARVIARLTRSTLRRADGTVFIGDRLRRYAEARYGAAGRAWTIEVGSEAALFKGPPADPREGSIRVLYSGQMGRMHDIDTVAGLLGGAPVPGVEIVLQASGSGYDRLRESARSSAWAVVWGAPLATQAWAASMEQSHLALVSVKRGAENVVFPSKTFSALLAGQAIVAVCPEDSDLADLVRRYDCGWVVTPGDVEGLRQLLVDASNHRQDLYEKQRRAQAAGRSRYALDALRPSWERVVQAMIATFSR